MATVTLLDLLEPLGATKQESAVSVEPAVDIQKMMAEARSEAAALKENARIEAEQILSSANNDAIAIRESARQEGLITGESEARVQISEEYRVLYEQYKEDLRSDIQLIIDDIVTARRRLWEQQEPEIVAFVMDIAKQVIKTEIQQNPDVLIEIIRNAIRRISDKENIRIRVNIADASRIKTMREDVMQMVDGLHNLEVIDDRRISPGGCVIETNAGTIDAKIETQIGEIERTITECLEV